MQDPQANRDPRDWRDWIWPFGTFLIIGVLALMFAHIASEVREGDWQKFDRNILLFLRRSDDLAVPIGPSWFTEAVRDVTGLGSAAVLSLLTAVVACYLFLVQRPATAVFTVVSIASGYALNDVLKFVFDRSRPDFVPPLIPISSSSFPSGHAAASAIAYFTLAMMLSHAEPQRHVRVYFFVVAAITTFLVGLSRIYLGVHYPTDVLAGWCIGLAYALGARLLAEYWKFQ